MLRGATENVFLSSCTPVFLPASNLILEMWGKAGGRVVGWWRGSSRDDTLLTLLALILMPHARGLYTIHFNAISSCQEG